MKYTAKLTFIFMALLMSHCSINKNTDQIPSSTEDEVIMEVTTFKTKPNVNPSDFNARDVMIEEDFTSKQAGFIKRQSGISAEGKYVVIVYWETASDADASMNKFMSDASVADYAQMIDAASMKMSRYAVDKAFDADDSGFVEVMSFDLKSGTDVAKFNALNQQVETTFTSKREGFLQRLTGTNEEGKHIVAVYWENQATSDASLEPFMQAPIAKEFMQKMNQSTVLIGRYKFLNMELTNKEKAVALLNSFNTGDQTPITYINPEQYIQHNLSVGDGLAGFGEVMQHAPPQGFKAEVVRAFEDGDFVFTHTIYDFFGPKIGFDIFRFEEGLIVEHWDNLIEVQAVNPSGRTQTDGEMDITDKDKTDANKAKIKEFIEVILLKGEMDKITNYINPTKYLQHNPAVADGLDGFGAAMQYFAENGLVMEYDKMHMVMGEGNFVLAVSEGKFGKAEHTAFYDLFRLEDGLIVEHWDVIATIPPKSEWKNGNGKF
ncbi:MAG: nuclear transport factor 2 family protein [Bacteroidota bacterium]